MPKQITEEELNVVIRTAARFPEGVSINGIAKAHEPPLQRRTLQRRLALIVRQKGLVSEGEGRGRRYRIPVTEKRALSSDQEIESPVFPLAEEEPLTVSSTSSRTPLMATVGIIAEIVHYKMPEMQNMQWPAQILAAFEHGLSVEQHVIQRFLNLGNVAGGRLNPAQAVEQLLSDGVDAVVVVGNHNLEVAIRLCEAAGVPLIALEYDRVPHPVHQVYVDSAVGGTLAARHLRERSYRNLIYLRPYSNTWVEARLLGARAVTGPDGLRVFPTEPTQGTPAIDGVHEKTGYEVGCVLLNAAFEPGTGVIAPNDFLAKGFMRAASERGLVPGKDYGIIGFDDRCREEHLTSLRPPIHQIGEEGARLMVRLLRGDTSATRIALQHRLISRASTAKWVPQNQGAGREEARFGISHPLVDKV